MLFIFSKKSASKPIQKSNYNMKSYPVPRQNSGLLSMKKERTYRLSVSPFLEECTHQESNLEPTD